MCMFTFPNKYSIKARIKGIEAFECGGCPECLQKKSRQWALRCGMEARSNIGMMLTLTYDTYKKDENGNDTTEENPVDISLVVNKAHCQRFVKRLRKHYPDKKIKYLITAEYGKRTHRAHYHALIFGFQFDDLRRYKKSKRGNIIYKSPTLEKIWSADNEHNGGICTVDCINLSAKTARYCTKYCAKDSGVDDTFMLFSRGIGETELLRNFNGKSYWIDGREYSIPRKIWQKVIENKYHLEGFSRYVGRLKVYDSQKRLCSKLDDIEKQKKAIQERISILVKRVYNHKNYYPKKRGFYSVSRREWYFSRMEELSLEHIILRERLSELEKKRVISWRSECNKLVNRERAYERAKNRREIYQVARDNDYLYKRYLSYWKRKNDVAEISRPSVITRILQLPDNKYRSYKSKALFAKIKQLRGFDFVPPRSNSQGFVRFPVKKETEEKPFAPLSRHYRANDTTDFSSLDFYREKSQKIAKNLQHYKIICENSPF